MNTWAADHPEEAGGLRVRWGWVWLAWLAVAVVFATQNVAGALASGVPVDWGWAVWHEAVYWAVWGALTPLILGCARRHRLGPEAGLRAWTAHAGLALLIAPLHIAAAYAIHGLSLAAIGSLPLSGLGGWLAERRAGFLVIALTGLWKYAVVVGVYYAFDYYRRWRREEEQSSALALRAARLEGRLARSKLAALRSRLRPHFLFNTLNSISVLVREAPEEAEATIRRLADLLRQTLEHEEVEEVSLERELAFVERYLEIQRTRYEDRLRVETDADPDALDAPVPFLILQPLVENAIQHGVDRRPGGGTVRIGARRRGGRLELRVEEGAAGAEDGETGPKGGEASPGAEAPGGPGGQAGAEGAGGEAASGDGGGTGLRDLRARLEQLYGDAVRFDAGPRPGGGFAVRIEIPLRPPSEARADPDPAPSSTRSRPGGAVPPPARSG